MAGIDTETNPARGSLSSGARGIAQLLWKAKFKTLFFFAAAAAMHVIVSLTAASAATWLFPQRIFDVRNFPEGASAPELIGAYMEARSPITDMAIGSSMTFGYPWMTRETFAAKAGLLNVSVVGGSLPSILDWTLCEMAARGIRAKRLLIEVPLVNELSWMGGVGRPTAPYGSTCPQSSRANLTAIALRTPMGGMWFKSLFDTSSRAGRPGPVRVDPVADNYFLNSTRFEEVKDEFAARIAETVRVANTVADEVYLFISPVYIPGVAEGGQNSASVLRQFQFAQAVCERVAARRCIDSSPLLYDKLAFYNLTHFSPAGHTRFAEILSAKLGSVERTTPAP